MSWMFKLGNWDNFELFIGKLFCELYFWESLLLFRPLDFGSLNPFELLALNLAHLNRVEVNWLISFLSSFRAVTFLLNLLEPFDSSIETRELVNRYLVSFKKSKSKILMPVILTANNSGVSWPFWIMKSKIRDESKKW